jgi:hypothetical protein
MHAALSDENAFGFFFSCMFPSDSMHFGVASKQHMLHMFSLAPGTICDIKSSNQRAMRFDRCDSCECLHAFLVQ